MLAGAELNWAGEIHRSGTKAVRDSVDNRTSAPLLRRAPESGPGGEKTPSATGPEGGESSGLVVMAEAGGRGEESGGFTLFGEEWVWPWSENAGGFWDTLGAYGRAAGRAAVGTPTGALAGGGTGALAGGAMGFAVTGGPGVLPGAGAGAVGGAIWGGVSGLAHAAFARDAKDAAIGGAQAGAVGGAVGGAVRAYGAVRGLAAARAAKLVRPVWARDAGSFVNWLKNLQKSGVKLTRSELDDIVRQARRLGVSVRLDPPHPGAPWNVPHLNIGKANVHLEVPPSYKLPP